MEQALRIYPAFPADRQESIFHASKPRFSNGLDGTANGMWDAIQQAWLQGQGRRQ
jgi:hypothetical protein